MFQVVKIAPLCLLFAACVHSGMQPISTRSPTGYPKEGNLMVSGRQPLPSTKKPELFVRQRQQTVKPNDGRNATGSLFAPDDERNFLYSERGPITEGKYVTVMVDSQRQVRKDLNDRLAKKAERDAGKKEDAGKKDKDKKEETVEETLLKALPSLEPGEGAPSLIKHFKMRIAHTFPNGDVMLQMQRRSLRDDGGNELNIKARVPYAVIVRGDVVSTNDLADIEWVETAGRDYVERSSVNWEDEYTLRLSGFDESKSRIAMDLDDKRRQLKEIREKVETQLKNIGDERRELARQRDEMISQKEKDKGTIDELQKTVAEQKDEIAKLNPADKPGEAKDGANGG